MPWTNGYTYKTTCTIGSGQVTGTLTNYPALVSLSSVHLATVANGGSIQNTVNQSGGSYTSLIPADFLVTSDSAGATQITGVEFEAYSASAGTALIWVNVSSAAAGSEIYIWYGNSLVSAQQGTTTSVWNSNYTSVYHFGASTLLGDSTSNGYNATQYGSGLTATAGQVGGGLACDGTGFGYTSNSQFSNTNSFTFSCWLNLLDWNNNYGVMGQGLDGLGSGWNISLLNSSSGSKPVFSTVFGASVSGSNNPFVNSTWHHITGTYVSSSGLTTLYQDGSSVASASTINSGRSSTIGIVFGLSEGIGDTSELTGTLDEVRISNTNLSASWIAADFNNQSAPNTFWSITYDATSSNNYTVSVSATMFTFNASISRGITKALNATKAVSSASLSRSVVKALSATSSRFMGSLSKVVTKALSATSSRFMGSLSKVVTKALSATSSSRFMGSLSKVVTKPLNATKALSSASLSKSVGKALSGTSSRFTSASLSRSISKAISATSNFVSATIATIKSKGILINAMMNTFSATLQQGITKHVSGASSPSSATVAKSITRTLSATMTSCAVTFSAIKTHLVSFAATMNLFSASLSKNVVKSENATSSVGSAKVTKTSAKQLAATMSSFTGSITKTSAKQLAATMSSFTGSMSKSIAFSISATAATVSGLLSRSIIKFWNAISNAASGALVVVGNHVIKPSRIFIRSVIPSTFIAAVQRWMFSPSFANCTFTITSLNRSMTFPTVRQALNALRLYQVDWTAQLTSWSDTITESTFTVSPSGMTLSDESNTTTTCNVWTTGGTVGLFYNITNHITTAAGRQDDCTFTVEIQQT